MPENSSLAGAWNLHSCLLPWTTFGSDDCAAGFRPVVRQCRGGGGSQDPEDGHMYMGSSTKGFDNSELKFVHLLQSLRCMVGPK